MIMIMFLGCRTVSLWMMSLSFQRRMLPPFSGSKCVVVLSRMGVGNVADVSEVHSASIFRVNTNIFVG
jgi:hypothetical protein